MNKVLVTERFNDGILYALQRELSGDRPVIVHSGKTWMQTNDQLRQFAKEIDCTGSSFLVLQGLEVWLSPGHVEYALKKEYQATSLLVFLLTDFTGHENYRNFSSKMEIVENLAGCPVSWLHMGSKSLSRNKKKRQVFERSLVAPKREIVWLS